MSRLQIVLAAKGVLAILALGLPMLFLPLEAFQFIDIPEYSAPSLFFIRMCGALMLSVATFQLWGAFDISHKKGVIVGTIVECVTVLLFLWHYFFYGSMATWPVFGKLLVLGFGGVEFAFLAAIVVTGWEAIFSRGAKEAAS